ncbi:hypothetical protein F2Q68_00025524 [Brassica cretica]|uniref:Uncharacterized protein n=1 Tax=Brassica cretica TaxID=69181 RepID=A0A8S9I7H1_BRACR|nr:hypothetical protein F2Q68_00025524 [Brassica cretica]
MLVSVYAVFISCFPLESSVAAGIISSLSKFEEFSDSLALARVSSNYFKICITRPSRAPACPPEFLKIQNSSALREPKFVASSTLASDSFFVMSIDRCLVVYVDRYFPSGLMETLENSCFFHGKATSSITGSLSIGASNSLSIVASDFSSIDASVECRSMLQSPIPIQLHGRSNKLQ